jgi:hypothetical protein
MTKERGTIHEVSRQLWISIVFGVEVTFEV